jgi:hypothetical protein
MDLIVRNWASHPFEDIGQDEHTVNAIALKIQSWKSVSIQQQEILSALSALSKLLADAVERKDQQSFDQLIKAIQNDIVPNFFDQVPMNSTSRTFLINEINQKVAQFRMEDMQSVLISAAKRKKEGGGKARKKQKKEEEETDSEADEPEEGEGDKPEEDEPEGTWGIGEGEEEIKSVEVPKKTKKTKKTKKKPKGLDLESLKAEERYRQWFRNHFHQTLQMSDERETLRRMQNNLFTKTTQLTVPESGVPARFAHMQALSRAGANKFDIPFDRSAMTYGRENINRDQSDENTGDAKHAMLRKQLVGILAFAQGPWSRELQCLLPRGEIDPQMRFAEEERREEPLTEAEQKMAEEMIRESDARIKSERKDLDRFGGEERAITRDMKKVFWDKKSWYRKDIPWVGMFFAEEQDEYWSERINKAFSAPPDIELSESMYTATRDKIINGELKWRVGKRAKIFFDFLKGSGAAPEAKEGAKEQEEKDDAERLLVSNKMEWDHAWFIGELLARIYQQNKLAEDVTNLMNAIVHQDNAEFKSAIDLLLLSGSEQQKWMDSWTALKETADTHKRFAEGTADKPYTIDTLQLMEGNTFTALMDTALFETHLKDKYEYVFTKPTFDADLLDYPLSWMSFKNKEEGQWTSSISEFWMSNSASLWRFEKSPVVSTVVGIPNDQASYTVLVRVVGNAIQAVEMDRADKTKDAAKEERENLRSLYLSLIQPLWIFAVHLRSTFDLLARFLLAAGILDEEYKWRWETTTNETPLVFLTTFARALRTVQQKEALEDAMLKLPLEPKIMLEEKRNSPLQTQFAFAQAILSWREATQQKGLPEITGDVVGNVETPLVQQMTQTEEAGEEADYTGVPLSQIPFAGLDSAESFDMKFDVGVRIRDIVRKARISIEDARAEIARAESYVGDGPKPKAINIPDAEARERAKEIEGIIRDELNANEIVSAMSTRLFRCEQINELEADAINRFAEARSSLLKKQKPVAERAAKNPPQKRTQKGVDFDIVRTCQDRMTEILLGLVGSDVAKKRTESMKPIARPPSPIVVKREVIRDASPIPVDLMAYQATPNRSIASILLSPKRVDEPLFL